MDGRWLLLFVGIGGSIGLGMAYTDDGPGPRGPEHGNGQETERALRMSQLQRCTRWIVQWMPDMDR